MKLICKIAFILLVVACICACKSEEPHNHQNLDKTSNKLTAQNILGNPDYQAISYGGYRAKTREIQPTIGQLKEDMKILSAMDIKILRTYNTHFAQAGNLLKAIHELKEEDPEFEMYVMLGAWINCEGAFTAEPNHEKEDEQANSAEINRAVKMAVEYPDIVKILAVGNEAMVKWAASYYVQPSVILKWVNYLQGLKKTGDLPADLWITSSDNFASWGGGEDLYHTPNLEKLIKAVDYVSLHTYPMHDTHYNPDFWGVTESERKLSKIEQINAAMERANEYAISQYTNTVNYIKSLGIDKPVHIGETGWASASNSLYGPNGSKATDEYKEGLYHEMVRKWSNQNGVSCFYFEAFDEIWKDARNPGGSENHFGLFTVDGKAKYAIWDQVDRGIFDGLTRDGNPIVKTYGGSETALQEKVLIPDLKKELTEAQ